MRTRCSPGPLEPTNDAYAIAKIAGIMQVQAIRREYGLALHLRHADEPVRAEATTSTPSTRHVLPALIRRFHEAKTAQAPCCHDLGHRHDRAGSSSTSTTWPPRLLHLLEHYDDPQPINVGTGADITIAQTAQAVADAVGYTGRIEWDASKPDGTPRKVLDVTRINALGWRAAISFSEGVEDAYGWYLNHVA